MFRAMFWIMIFFLCYRCSYFHQKVDHFDRTNLDFFGQRYFVNLTYYRNEGPLFILVGGELPISTETIKEELLMINQYAKKHNGMMVNIECRFYGLSVPYDSLSVDSLKYLRTSQILADYSDLISYLKSVYGNGNTKIILIGGSYAGTLAAWMKMKYPYLVDGVISSSAPVVAKIEFIERIENIFEILSPNFGRCGNKFRKALTEASNTLSNHSKKLEFMFDSCDVLEGDNKYAFFEDLVFMIGGVIQSGKFFELIKICEYLHTYDSPLRGLAEYLRKLKTYGCYNFSYQYRIERLKNEDVWPKNTYASERAWLYQKCTEYGWFIEVIPEIPNLLSFSCSSEGCLICKNVFGSSFGFPNTEFINTEFQGDDVIIENVLFTVGSEDPWKLLSPKNNIHLIIGGTHCSDLFVWKEGYAEDIRIAHNIASKYLSKWIYQQ